MAENILDRIAGETDLTKSERKLAAVILKDPAKVVGENIAQLAQRSGVSEPSICRFCKRFGTDGFPGLKLVLSSIVSTENLRKVDSVRQGDSVGDVISKVLGSAKASLSQLERGADEEMIARVIDVVSQSRRIIVLCQGISEGCGTDFQKRLLSVGFPCECYTDRQSMALALSSMHTQDVALALSATGDNQDIIDASKCIEDTGGVLIAIAPKESAVAALSRLCLNTGDAVLWESDDIMSQRLCVMMLCQIIISGLILRRGIAIADLKEKMKKGRSYAYSKKTEAEDSNDSSSLAEDDGRLKSGSPITTLDWRPY